MGRAAGIYQQGRRAECSGSTRTEGTRADLNNTRLITGEGLPNITED